MRKTISIVIVLILLLGLPARLVKADSVKNISVIQNIAVPGDDFIGSISLAEANLYEDDYNSKYLFPMQGICTAGTGKIAVIDNSYGRVHILDGFLDNVLTFGSLSTLIYPTDIDYKEGIFYVSDALNGKVQFFSGNGAFIKTLDAGFLNTPTGITVSKGYLFVSDYFENTIYKLDMNGNIKKTANIDYPGGLASDADGNIYAVSMSGKNVYKFDTDLNILLVVIGEELLFPSDVAIGMGGNIFVSDRGLSRGGTTNGRIVQYSASGKYIKKIGKTAESYYSQQDGALLTPAGIAADMLGNIYVMDAGYYYWDINSDAPFGHSMGSRLSVFSEAGIFLSKKESPQDVNGRLVNPIGATLDENGNIWVVNYGGFTASELVQFSPSGSLVRRIDKLDGDAFPSAYSILSDKAGNIFVGLYGGIAIYGSNGSVKNVLYDDRLGQVGKIIKGIDGYFYATLFDKNSVVKFDYLGNIIQIRSVCKFPSGIAQDSDGNFYIASINDNKIHCFDNTFTEQRTIGEGGGRGTMQFYVPEDVATDKAGNLVVADTENGRISVFSTKGDLLYQSERIFYEITSIEVENGTFLVTDCFHNIIRVLFEDISSSPYDAYFSAHPEAVIARPGEEINITMSVMNVGSNGDGYNISVKEAPEDWDIGVANGSFFLAANESKQINLTIMVPVTAKDGDSVNITLKLMSSHNLIRSVVVTVMISTHLPAKLSIGNSDAMESETTTIPVNITGVENMRGLSFVITYNSNNISIINVEKGELFKDGLIVHKISSEKILVAVSVKGKTAVSGSGNVAFVTVKGEKISVNTLQLQNVIVENVLNERLEILIEKGVFTVKPYLHLNFTDGVTVSNSTFFFTGRVSTGSSLTINGKKINVKADGTFDATVLLSAQQNMITAAAVYAGGEETTITKIVFFKGSLNIVIKLKIGNPYMLVNGTENEIDPGRGTIPVIVNGWDRTVVPIRAIVETLGGMVQWEEKERKVTVQLDTIFIYLWIDNPKALMNDVPVWIDTNNHNVSPIIMNDRTFVPLRFVAENLGCVVDWDGTTRTVTITYNE